MVVAKNSYPIARSSKWTNGGKFSRCLSIAIVLSCFHLRASLAIQVEPHEREETPATKIEEQRKVDEILLGPKSQRVNQQEYELNTLIAQARSNSAKSLKGAVAAGWAIQTEVSPQFAPDMGRTVLVTSPIAGRGFCLCTDGFFHSNEAQIENRDTIYPDSELMSQPDLTRFFEVNNQLLKDSNLRSPRQNDSFLSENPGNPTLASSSVIVISGARLSNGVEVVTFFDLRNSCKTGRLHGSVAVVEEPLDSDALIAKIRTPKRALDVLGLNGSAKNMFEVATELGIIANSSAKRRVYYYGDDLTSVQIRRVVEAFGHEFIRRSP